MITSPVNLMWQNRCATVKEFGRDQSGTIDYCFNSQGFRSNVDYDFVPEYALFGCSIMFGIGVPYKQTIAGQFNNVHNYGLASNYTNTDCFNLVEKFVNSQWYDPGVKMAVVWTFRDQELLPACVERLQPYQMIHLFCGDKLDFPNCYKFIANLDQDASNTHPGPRTHNFAYRLLCQLFSAL